MVCPGSVTQQPRCNFLREAPPVVARRDARTWGVPSRFFASEAKTEADLLSRTTGWLILPAASALVYRPGLCNPKTARKIARLRSWPLASKVCRSGKAKGEHVLLAEPCSAEPPRHRNRVQAPSRRLRNHPSWRRTASSIGF